MAIALVQSTSATATNASSVAKAFTSNNTAGNLIVVACAWDGGRAFTSVTDSKGNTYNLAGLEQVTSDNKFNSRIMYAMNIAAGANTVTLTINGGGNLTILIHEYSGAVTASALDQASQQTGTTNNQSSPSVTTTQANELIFGFTGIEGSTTLPTAGTGYTIEQTASDGTNADASEQQIVSSTGSFSATWNDTAVGTAWNAHIATFKAAATGTVTHFLAMMGIGT